MATELPTHRLIAFNTATSSENKIHDDEVAGALGFGGGLVPGVDVYAYLCHPVVARWGTDVLTRGRISTRFGTPTYDGQSIEVRAVLDENGSGATLHAGVHPVPSAGQDAPEAAAAILEARLVDEPAAAPTVAAGPKPTKDDRQPASPDSLAAGTVLGTFRHRFTAEDHTSYLADIRDEASPTADLGLVHPGAILRLANTVLSETVLLGPWIHVGSTIHNHAPIAIGDEVEVRGVVTANSERKGHRFVDLDVVILGAGGGTDDAGAGGNAPGEIRTWIEHTAIYEPRQLRTDV
jgi:acyl dehydratase